MNSAFGNAVAPDHSSISFGEYTYRSKSYKEGQPYLKIEADVVFGKLDITEW
jgi:hypothetical protein